MIQYRVPRWPIADHDFHTESVLRAISFNVSPAAGEWARRMAEHVDPRGQRDAAIRAAAAIIRQPAISATAKKLEAELGRYLIGFWHRGDRDCSAASPEWSELRMQLFLIVNLNDGEGLGWRQILRVIEI